MSGAGPEYFLKFVNSTTFTVKIDWIDQQGQLQTYANLEPGQSHDLQTYCTHPWAFTSSGGLQAITSLLELSDSEKNHYTVVIKPIAFGGLTLQWSH